MLVRSVALLIVASATFPAVAQTRAVIINGQRATDSQIAYLEQRACTRIPNGNYWLDPQSGAWGYVGDPRVRGVLGQACGQRGKSLSERRQLYRPGEILSQ
jgi:hypothetical protein